RSDESRGRARPATPGHVGQSGPGDAGSVGGRRNLFLCAAGIGGDGAFIALSERRWHIRLDEARARRRPRIYVRVVLLDQQRSLLSEPAYFGGGGRNLRHRRRRFKAGRKLRLRHHHDTGHALDRNSSQYCRRRNGQVASEPRRNRNVHSGNYNHSHWSYGLLTHPAANSITVGDLTPKSTDYNSLNLWASIAFAYAGLELSATMGGEVSDARRTLPRSIFISAPLIAIIYILGTGSVLWTVPNEQINVASGFLQTIDIGMRQISANLWWVAPICAVLYSLSSLGGVGAWLAGPARVALGIGLDRYFPPAFGKIHPRWKTPYVAILAQTVLATLFLLITQIGEDTRVGQVYLVLLSAQLIIYYVTYIYLFIVFLIH